MGRGILQTHMQLQPPAICTIKIKDSPPALQYHARKYTLKSTFSRKVDNFYLKWISFCLHFVKKIHMEWTLFLLNKLLKLTSCRCIIFYYLTIHTFMLLHMQLNIIFIYCWYFALEILTKQYSTDNFYNFTCWFISIHL